MKSIEEKMNDAYKNAGSNAYFGNGFYAGYKAAFEWISVDDELPKDKTEILVKNTEWTDYMFYTSDDKDTIMAEYTHWRPINNY